MAPATRRGRLLATGTNRGGLLVDWGLGVRAGLWKVFARSSKIGHEEAAPSSASPTLSASPWAVGELDATCAPTSTPIPSTNALAEVGARLELPSSQGLHETRNNSITPMGEGDIDGMAHDRGKTVTGLLEDLREGRREAFDKLFPLV